MKRGYEVQEPHAYTGTAFFFTFTSSLGAEVTDRELVFCEYFTRRTIAIDCFYI